MIQEPSISSQENPEFIINTKCQKYMETSFVFINYDLVCNSMLCVDVCSCLKGNFEFTNMKYIFNHSIQSKWIHFLKEKTVLICYFTHVHRRIYLKHFFVSKLPCCPRRKFFSVANASDISQLPWCLPRFVSVCV